MLKRLLLAVCLLFASLNAAALEYTDVYYNPAESGWGVFLVQSDATQFLAFFIYGTDNKPTWYTAQLAKDTAGNYNGQLFATTGTYFGLPWNPAQLSVAAVGTVSFVPTDIYKATLTYALTAGPTVTKTVQRQTLAPYVLAGNYSGSMSGTITGCADPADNDPKFRGRYGLAVTQTADTASTLIFTFTDTAHTGLVITVAGSLTHLGRLYKLTGQFSAISPGETIPPFPATIESYHPTGQGIEGRLTSTLGDGCKLSLPFAAVLNN
ncbi:MAG: hypothetical protein ABI981_13625 [Betaproteobacteria bacterium]